MSDLIGDDPALATDGEDDSVGAESSGDLVDDPLGVGGDQNVDDVGHCHDGNAIRSATRRPHSVAAQRSSTAIRRRCRRDVRR